jgi:hypothetical protein
MPEVCQPGIATNTMCRGALSTRKHRASSEELFAASFLLSAHLGSGWFNQILLESVSFTLADVEFYLLENAPALHPTSIAANAPMTSSATPPLSTTILVTWEMRFLFMPPLGGVHTPEVASSSRCVSASALDVGAVPPVAEFIEFGMPGGVRCEGGSMVRIDTMRAPVEEDEAFVHAIASTASATASSSLQGSKMMFAPTAMARMMTGGLSVEALPVLLG